jgi:DNA-binding response OmpR family regulator
MHASSNEIRHLTTTILIAECDQQMRSLHATSLRRAGHIVWEAPDGGEALRLVRAHAPELLLVDVWMPVMNGLEVLENLRGSTVAVGLKVIVFSQNEDADIQLEGFALGVDDYWMKDLSPEELCDRVQNLVRLADTPPWGWD